MKVKLHFLIIFLIQRTHINMPQRNWSSPPPGLGYRTECEINGTYRCIGERDVASHLMCVARAKGGDHRCSGKKGLRWGLLQRRFVKKVQDVLSIPVFSWGQRNTPQKFESSERMWDVRSSEDGEKSLRRLWTSMPNISYIEKENEALPQPQSYQLWRTASLFNNNVNKSSNNSMDDTDDCVEAKEPKRTPMGDILVLNENGIDTLTRETSVEYKEDVDPLLKRSVSLFSLLDVRNSSPQSKSPGKQKYKRDTKKKEHIPQHAVETQVLSRCSSSNSHFGGFNILPYTVARC